MPRSRIAWSMAAAARLRDPPGGRLKEIVAATRPLWWLTWVAVWLLTYVASAGSGTMVSAAVLSALPVELPPLLLAMLLVTALASALALCALVLDAAPRRGRHRGERAHRADRARPAPGSAGCRWHCPRPC